MNLGELKKMLSEFPDDTKVVSSSVYRQHFEDLKGEPMMRFVKAVKGDGETYGDWTHYEPLYSSQEEMSDEKVLVIW